jgi:hypothetical protein
VHGDDRVEAGTRAPAYEELLVFERLEIAVDER